MQRLTYDYYLPEVLGNYGMQQLGNYEGYSEVTNAGVAIEVATAALRFGHTLIPQVLRRLNENYKPFILGDVPIAEALFAPDKLLFDGGIDALIRGAVTSSLMGEILDEDTTRTLSPNFRILPLDLISIDVARGKDHGLPPYNAYRIYCGLKEIKSFEEFGDLTENGINSTLFAHSFDNIDNIDLLVGGLLEKPVGGGLVGPTLWYERSEVFSADQLKAVKSYSFGKILCNNLDESGLMLENPFVFSLEAPRCFTMEDLNLAAWKDQ
uniref:Peroxidase n=1 Tax=Plectus sambesii TaxID=2011161 RepID=A0A914UJB1_9BILA